MIAELERIYAKIAAGDDLTPTELSLVRYAFFGVEK